MKELKFDTGLVSYTVNGIEGAICFNPTDSTFFKRLFETFNALDAKCEAYQKKILATTAENAAERYALLNQLDAEISAAIDEVFDRPGLSDLIFTNDGKKVSPNALAGGLPIWANFILAIADESDDSIKAQEKLSRSRIDKYAKKYHK